MEYLVTTFYKFTALDQEQLGHIKAALEEKARELHIWGLTLLAPEGINATLAGGATEIATYQGFLREKFGELRFRDSVSNMMPFKRFKVKIKEEIVQLKRPDVIPKGEEPHVAPEKWDEMVEEGMVLIDVRNTYETKVGTFKNAIDPKTRYFSQFPEWLKKSGIPKYERIGIFCTGGIRCDKAAIAMKEQGYEEVYQLDGGILNYIEKRPNKNFEGECFVFDHRAAVGQDLRPSSTYSLCANCGNAGAIDRTCVHCQKLYRTCDECVATLPIALCSKDCRYQYTKAQVVREK